MLHEYLFTIILQHFQTFLKLKFTSNKSTKKQVMTKSANKQQAQYVTNIQLFLLLDKVTVNLQVYLLDAFL